MIPQQTSYPHSGATRTIKLGKILASYDADSEDYMGVQALYQRFEEEAEEAEEAKED